MKGEQVKNYFKTWSNYVLLLGKIPLVLSGSPTRNFAEPLPNYNSEQ